MRILHLSDSHSQHRSLPAFPVVDMIIHSGDVSFAGESGEIMDFIDWFGSLDCKYRIFIAGNHDFCLDGKDAGRIQKFLPENMYYLYNSGIIIDGVRFWGIPYFISCELRPEKYWQGLSSIPVNTDVLITHRPPFEILDTGCFGNMGCPCLLETVRRIRPRYHLFGHIHDAYGTVQNEDTTFINGAVMNDSYVIVNDPVVFEI
jgi:predicted phosphohydrolase